MGVNYCHCTRCEESRYSEFVERCDKCEQNICTSCVTNDDIDSQYARKYCVRFDGTPEQMEEYGITQEHIDKGWVKIGEVIDDTGIDPKYCPFCNGNSVSSEMLLNFALGELSMTKTQLKEKYLSNMLKGNE